MVPARLDRMVDSNYGISSRHHRAATRGFLQENIIYVGIFGTSQHLIEHSMASKRNQNQQKGPRRD